jgi:hypothetical protein
MWNTDCSHRTSRNHDTTKLQCERHNWVEVKFERIILSEISENTAIKVKHDRCKWDVWQLEFTSIYLNDNRWIQSLPFTRPPIINVACLTFYDLGSLVQKTRAASSSKKHLAHFSQEQDHPNPLPGQMVWDEPVYYWWGPILHSSSQDMEKACFTKARRRERTFAV